ncbi:AMP-binding enzyme [Planifilum fimeticola]|uniref:AMP-binding enzyme n=1 Tax=Planifilum fimeticola TaxID=201975 RepID=A0A2T0LAQ9_9BACL|nr:AMP-binding enzyme [Planifilum fimeticola]
MITPLTPLDWKRRAVKYYPEKVAVIDGEKRLTYKQFDERVNRLSNALLSAGIGKGDHVALIMTNTHQMLERHRTDRRGGRSGELSAVRR